MKAFLFDVLGVFVVVLFIGSAIFMALKLVDTSPSIPMTKWRAIVHGKEGGKNEAIDFKAEQIKLTTGGIESCIEFITDGRTQGVACGVIAVGKPE